MKPWYEQYGLAKPFYGDEWVCQIGGDCLKVLPKLPDNSIDLLVTDPPYGIGFMGKDWDKALPDKRVWAECLRVLKPGAFAFVMSIPRADCLSRMIISLEDAGFWVNFTPIFWAYACLSSDTEVLTREGWKDWEHLRKSNNQDIMVCDAEKGYYLFESPSAWNSYSIREDMFRIESKDTEQLVSRNHKVYTERGFILAENLKEQESVVFLSSLPSNIRDISCGDKEEGNSRDVLFGELSPKSEYPKVYCSQQNIRNRRSELVRGAKAATARSDDGRKELGLEGWGNLLQNKGQLCRSKICSLSERILGYGTQRRLCYGASFIGSPTIGETIIENRDSSSQQPQSSRQQSSGDALCQQPRPQTIRGGTSHKTTLARVYRQYYEGIVYCPTVSTGCFVARRNGKIFLTGNSGFPKAQNIGKAVDKRGGKYLGWFIDYILEVAEQKGITKREISALFPSKHGKPTGWLWNKKYTQAITLEQYNKIKDFLGLPFDTLEEAERKIVGKGKAGLGSGKTYAFTDNNKTEGIVDVTKPASPQAKALDGSYGGFQPKPAVEVIIVAMKPLSEKTFVDQALKNRKGITWLDEGRIPLEGIENHKTLAKSGLGKHGIYRESTIDEIGGKDLVRYTSQGRFPANLLVSDDVLNDGRNIKAGGSRTKKHGATGQVFLHGGECESYGDSGSFSRYFDLDAWFAEKIKQLPESAQKTFPFLIVPKASKSEKNKGLSGEGETIGQSAKNRVWADKCANCGLKFIGGEPRCHCEIKVTSKEGGYKYKNFHPTVKPLKLMIYLITLGSRAGDVVLDPYIGSGTTAVASKILSRKCIGIEINPDYSRLNEMRAIQPVQAVLL